MGRKRKYQKEEEKEDEEPDPFTHFATRYERAIKGSSPSVNPHWTFEALFAVACDTCNDAKEAVKFLATVTPFEVSNLAIWRSVLNLLTKPHLVKFPSVAQHVFHRAKNIFLLPPNSCIRFQLFLEGVSQYMQETLSATNQHLRFMLHQYDSSTDQKVDRFLYRSEARLARYWDIAASKPRANWWFRRMSVPFLHLWLTNMEAHPNKRSAFNITVPSFMSDLPVLAESLSEDRWRLLERAYALTSQCLYVTLSPALLLSLPTCSRLIRILHDIPNLCFFQNRSSVFHCPSPIHPFYANLVLRLPPKTEISNLDDAKTMVNLYDAMQSDVELICTTALNPLLSSLPRDLCTTIVLSYFQPYISK